MIEFIFWILIILIFYAYFGYPAVIYVLAKLRPRAVEKSGHLPKVSLITSAYNEEKCIREKIENSLALDYPREKLEIIFASDGSTDLTDSIISGYRHKGITFFKFDVRRGKASCLNDAVSASTGEILVFTDANAIYDPDAILRLVADFSDERIGAVTGEVRYVLDKSSSNEGEGLYSKYERFIRIYESAFNSVIGLNGAMYAIRRGLVSPFKKDTIAEDFLTALNVLRGGYRIAYEPQARGVEEIATSTRDEFRRKIRMIAGGYQAFKETGGLFGGFSIVVLFQFISHKLLRWLVPFFLIGIFALNLFLLNSVFYRVFLALQVFFYAGVMLGCVLEKRNIKTPLSLLYYFTAVNAAGIAGFIRFLAGSQKVTWSRGR